MTSPGFHIGETPTESTALIPRDSHRLIKSAGPRNINHQRSDSSPSCRSTAPNSAGNSATSNDYHEPSHERLKPISGVNLCLLNTGSVARDHLASERTYLSYVRTSLALSSAGVALMQFLRLGESTKPLADILGSLSIIVGILVLFIGTRRFFLVQKSLVNGYFPASSFEMISLSFILGSLITATFGVIIAGRIG